jgi:hypothetical protein
MPEQRPTATQRGYDGRWRRTRARVLRDRPLCECDDCLLLPAVRRPKATDVDHIDGKGPLGPRGHDPTNLRPMAHSHHSKRTARDQRPNRRRPPAPHPGFTAEPPAPADLRGVGDAPQATPSKETDGIEADTAYGIEDFGGVPEPVLRRGAA